MTLHGFISIILTEEKINLYNLYKNYSICINRYFIILTGYLIPKGWRIYVYTREINYDTSLYEDPMIFNPWRWMVSICNTQFFVLWKLLAHIESFFGFLNMQEKSLESKSYFLLFGGGARLCPGKELGISEVSSFIHYFVTRYKYVLHPCLFSVQIYDFVVVVIDDLRP